MNWIRNSAGGAEVYVYDDIGFFGVGANAFRQELRALGDKPLLVRINSIGGDLADAFAIANLLSERGNVTTQIDGLAASAASVIALAGKTRRMAENATIMIHEPSVAANGNAQDHEKAMRALEVFRDTLAAHYARKTGNPQPKVRSWMKDETWFNAADAKRHNFIDEIGPAVTVTARFDLSAFRNVPAQFSALKGQARAAACFDRQLAAKSRR